MVGYHYTFYNWPKTSTRLTFEGKSLPKCQCNTSSIIFEARGSYDVHVLFSFCDGCDGFEIVIGGWNNAESVIREYKQENTNKTEVWYTNTLHFIFFTLLDIKYPEHN